MLQPAEWFVSFIKAFAQMSDFSCFYLRWLTIHDTRPVRIRYRTTPLVNIMIHTNIYLISLQKSYHNLRMMVQRALARFFRYTTLQA